jgi:hypothetical protein
MSLRVTGVLEAQSNVAVTGQVAAQSVFVNADMTLLGNLYGWKPYYCAGRVTAVPGSSTPNTSVGRVGYTVWRPGTHPTGVFGIRFDTPAPSAEYAITLTLNGTGTIKVWESANYPPTADGFHAVVLNASSQLSNIAFYFTVGF